MDIVSQRKARPASTAIPKISTNQIASIGSRAALSTIADKEPSRDGRRVR